MLIVKKVLLLFCAALLSCNSSYDYCAALAIQTIPIENWGDLIVLSKGENPNLPAECKLPTTQKKLEAR